MTVICLTCQHVNMSIWCHIQAADFCSCSTVPTVTCSLDPVLLLFCPVKVLSFCFLLYFDSFVVSCVPVKSFLPLCCLHPGLIPSLVPCVSKLFSPQVPRVQFVSMWPYASVLDLEFSPDVLIANVLDFTWLNRLIMCLYLVELHPRHFKAPKVWYHDETNCKRELRGRGNRLRSFLLFLELS